MLQSLLISAGEFKIKKDIIFKLVYNPNKNYKEKDGDEKNPKLRLFGDYFIYKNFDKCRIIYKNKEYKIKDYMEEIDKNYDTKNLVKFKLRFLQNIIDIKLMFECCNALISVSDNKNDNKKEKIYKMVIKINNSFLNSEAFNNNNIIYNVFKQLSLYPSYTKKFKAYFSFNDNNNIEIIFQKMLFLSSSIIKVISMFGVFFQCFYLITLPNMSNWNTSNVVNMNGMFSECKSLISLPDISKWNTSKVTDMEGIFYNCESLISLPDISKWNTSNVTEIYCMFYKCYSLISLPDISKWNISNVTNMGGLFWECYSLILLPDLSKWNTSNIIYITKMFRACKSLISLPDMSKWNTSNVTIMEGIFSKCESLKSLPDISK